MTARISYAMTLALQAIKRGDSPHQAALYGGVHIRSLRRHLSAIQKAAPAPATDPQTTTPPTGA
jgi:hypothetical protein